MSVPLSDADTNALLARMSVIGKEFANHGTFAIVCIVYSQSSGVKLYTATPTPAKAAEMPLENLVLFESMLCAAAEMLGETPVSIEYHDVRKGQQ